MKRPAPIIVGAGPHSRLGDGTPHPMLSGQTTQSLIWMLSTAKPK